MNSSELLNSIQNIATWKRGTERAPHKPLLILYLLGRVYSGDFGPYLYADIEPALKQLLREFGPPRRSHRPQYPFWRLQTDGFWRVEAVTPVRVSDGDVSPRELIEKQAKGNLTSEAVEVLEREPATLQLAAGMLLEEHFPTTLFDDIRLAVGLPQHPELTEKRRRDPAFRERVISAYGCQCAVCGFDARTIEKIVGLEAAHIQWHAYEGTDEVKNGISLCTIHHKLFDSGAFTINDRLEVVVSEKVTGNEMVDSLLFQFHGRRINVPQNTNCRPNPASLAWHAQQVFFGRPRQNSVDPT
jgi:putative restriction endonuclease